MANLKKKQKQTQRKLKKQKEQRKYEARSQQQISCALISKLFSDKLSQPELQGSSALSMRTFWRGVSKGNDSLAIEGLEVVCYVYPTREDKENWENGVLVGLIEFEKVIGEFVLPGGRGVFAHYRGKMLHLLDKTTSYGMLLAQQQHKGRYRNNEILEDVRVRDTDFLLNHTRPSEKEREVFKSHGGSSPKKLLCSMITPMSPFDSQGFRKEPDELPELGPETLTFHNLSDDLSSAEVDFVWRASGCVAELLAEPAYVVTEREKRIKFLRREIQTLTEKYDSLVTSESFLEAESVYKKAAEAYGNAQDAFDIAEGHLAETEEHSASMLEEQLVSLAEMEKQIAYLKEQKNRILSHVRDKGPKRESEKTFAQITTQLDVLCRNVERDRLEHDKFKTSEYERIHQLKGELKKEKERLDNFKKSFRSETFKVFSLRKERSALKENAKRYERELAHYI